MGWWLSSGFPGNKNDIEKTLEVGYIWTKIWTKFWSLHVISMFKNIIMSYLEH